MSNQTTTKPFYNSSIPSNWSAPEFGEVFLFLKSFSFSREQLTHEKNGAVIGLPANLFFGTGIPAAILIFNKSKTSKNFLFIDASQHHENAKNQNKLRTIDFEHIVNTYREFTVGKTIAGVWKKILAMWLL